MWKTTYENGVEYSTLDSHVDFKDLKNIIQERFNGELVDSNDKRSGFKINPYTILLNPPNIFVNSNIVRYHERKIYISKNSGNLITYQPIKDVKISPPDVKVFVPENRKNNYYEVRHDVGNYTFTFREYIYDKTPFDVVSFILERRINRDKFIRILIRNEGRVVPMSIEEENQIQKSRYRNSFKPYPPREPEL